MRLEDVPCPLGCVAPVQPVVASHDRLHGMPGRFTVVECTGCGLLRTSPRPAAEDLDAYYPDEYGAFLERPTRPVARSRVRRWLARLVDSRAHDLPPMERGRALELGCGSGSFLASLAARGWDAIGVEPSATAAEQARGRGVTVIHGTLATLEAEHPKPVDLAVAWMVLEHLPDPVGELRRLRRLVSEDGWLALSVPNGAALERRLFGSYWYALHLPNHLWHFTPATLTCVLREGGWEMQRITHQRTISNLVGSMGLLLDRPGTRRLAGPLLRFPRSARRSRHLAAPLAAALAALGQTGRMTIWARPVP